MLSRVIRVLAICFIGLALVAQFGCESQESIQSTSVTGKTIRYYVTAVELYSAYEANELAADQKYEDRVIQVTGIIDDIGEDIMGDAYITLVGDESGWHSVQCYFPHNERRSLSSLRKGQSVRVKGVCDGKTIMNVLVKGCELL